MPRCSFCKRNYEFPLGLTLILNDGNILYFCSAKCRKNHDLKRDNKKVNWIRKDSVVDGESVERQEKAEKTEKVEKAEKPAEEKKEPAKEAKKEQKEAKKEEKK